MGNRSPCRFGLALVAICLAVTTTHWIEFLRADFRALLADTGTICNLARADGEVAKLAFLARETGYSPTNTTLVAASLVIDGDHGRRRQAGIAIGLSVASAYWQELSRTGRRYRFTHTLSIDDLALAFSQVTVLSVWTGATGNTTAGILSRNSVR